MASPVSPWMDYLNVHEDVSDAGLIQMMTIAAPTVAPITASSSLKTTCMP